MKKKYYLEVIRILAILMVMYNHSAAFMSFSNQSGVEYAISFLFSMVCKGAVPLFFMVSGALLLGKNESGKDLFQKRILRMILVIVIFSFLYYMKLVLKGERPFAPFSFLLSLPTDLVYLPYWFLYSYLGVLTILPILRPLAQNMSKNTFWYLIILQILLDCLKPTAWVLWGYGLCGYYNFSGFSQGMTYSFESPKVYDKLLLPQDSPLRKAVVISNPLGEDFSIMRTISLNGMLTSLSTNFNRRNKNVRLYELGNIYLPKQVPVTELPEERMQFTLGMYGEGDFFTMKGVIEEFLYKAGMKLKPEYDPEAGKPFLHPGRQANVVYDGTVIGYLGEVHPTVAANYAIKERVYVAVLDMPEIVSRASFDHKYEGIAKFPAAARDISMVVPKKVLAGDIEKIFDEKGGQFLEKYDLFDIYEGAQIKPGYKSIAYSLSFRAKDRNLEDADITGAMDRIVKALEHVGAELRN